GYLVLLFSLMSFVSMAQHAVSGIVVDKSTGEPLAFANLLFDGNRKLAVATDMDGKFIMRAAVPLREVVCTYVGYEAVAVRVEAGKQHIIEMTDKNDRQDVIIRPGENPDNRIIRLDIANKKINNPEDINSFTYKSYNKIVYDIRPDGKS